MMRIAKIWAVGLAVVLAMGGSARGQSGVTAVRGRSVGSDLPAKGDLRVYFVDVEGGQSTLFVMPSGESLLVDTGNPGARDAGRIAAMCKLAGVTKIDTLLITHYHADHVGGMPALVSMIPVGRIIDHGVNRQTTGPEGVSTVQVYGAYQNALPGTKAVHLVGKPWDVLPVKGMRVQVVSADGDIIGEPLKDAPGAGEKNPACAASPMKDVEDSENDRSLGTVITFGKTRILDLGDLTWAKERDLVCPVNKLGRFDVYIISHHGLDRSNSPAFVDAIAPRVAIEDNGPYKGGAPSTYDTVEGTSRLKDMWQLHTAMVRNAKNVADSRIANLPGATDDANYLELTVRPDGRLAVTNSRTGDTVEYPAN